MGVFTRLLLVAVLLALAGAADWSDIQAWLSGLPWKQLATFAPVVTALVALSAAIVATFAILVQKDIARRRAAIDFFLKTEMDNSIIDLYEKFKQRTPTFQTWAKNVDFKSDPD